MLRAENLVRMSETVALQACSVHSLLTTELQPCNEGMLSGVYSLTYFSPPLSIFKLPVPTCTEKPQVVYTTITLSGVHLHQNESLLTLRKLTGVLKSGSSGKPIIWQLRILEAIFQKKPFRASSFQFANIHSNINRRASLSQRA